MSNERPQKKTYKGSPQANFNNQRSLFDILRFRSLVGRRFVEQDHEIRD